MLIDIFVAISFALTIEKTKKVVPCHIKMQSRELGKERYIPAFEGPLTIFQANYIYCYYCIFGTSVSFNTTLLYVWVTKFKLSVLILFPFRLVGIPVNIRVAIYKHEQNILSHNTNKCGKLLLCFS